MNEDQEFIEYDKFSKKMEATFPEMFEGQYGGFAIGKGWWPIIEKLCNSIQSHINHSNTRRERLLLNNEFNDEIPEVVEQVRVAQIKEKFGGLRFYYDGGDEYISGLVRMAELWADASCEECGAPGRRTSSGWVKNLCEKHAQEHEARRAAFAKANGLEE